MTCLLVVMLFVTLSWTVSDRKELRDSLFTVAVFLSSFVYIWHLYAPLLFCFVCMEQSQQ